MLKKKHLLIRGFSWIVVFVLVLASVLGVVSSSGGLSVLTPQNNFYKSYSVSELNFQVFNSSNALLNPSVYNCNISIYNPSGVESLNSVLVANGLNVYTNFSASNEGLYHYFVSCDSSSEFGFVADSFEVTSDGFESSANWLAFLFLFAVIGFGMLFSAFSIKPKGLRGVKLLSFLYGIVNILLLGIMSYFVLIHPSRLHFLKGWSIAYISVTVIVLLAIIYLYMVFLLTKVFKQAGDDDD